MRRRPPHSPTPAAIPDGWYPIQPTDPSTSRARSPVDGLGLAKGVHAANLRVPRVDDLVKRSDVARSSPRHRRLQQQPYTPHDHKTGYTASDAFAPNRSLRLASLKPRVQDGLADPRATNQQHQHGHEEKNEPDLVKHVKRIREVSEPGGLSARSRAMRFRESRAPPIVPLHEVVCGFDDAVDASPVAESNQVAVIELFAANWIDRFDRERGLYKSIVLHAEIAFRELYRLTTNLASPNDVVTSFTCKIFDDLAEHFGPFSAIMRVLGSELRQSIYAPPCESQMPPHQPLPYYAIVKNQKRILISLRRDQMRRQERNDFLRYEIDKVHDTLLHFLDQCGLGLVRTIFHEWYSVAVVSKRNSKKYIEYFSAWFGGSAKALVPRLFLAWKSLAVETKVSRLYEQLTIDQAKLASVQKQIEELTVQRNLAQLESLAIRNDRKHAEDTIQRLHRKIQSASAFLEDSQRREALVAHEGQLRVEAATFLPPLVLESMLRGFHNVGFLQPLHNEFAPVASEKVDHLGPKTKAPSCTPTQPVVDGSALSQCITALRSSSRPNAYHHALSEGSTKENLVSTSIAQGTTLHDCMNFVQGIKLRVEDDPTAYLLFLPKTEFGPSKPHQITQRPHKTVDEEDVNDANLISAQYESPLALQGLVSQFNLALQTVRHQDEHYARHAKLFNSRMLEVSEISVVPHTMLSPHGDAPPSPLPPQISNNRILFSSIDSARVALSTSATFRLDQEDTSAGDVPLDQLPLVQPHDLELSPQHTRAFIILTLGQLLIEYGSLLFSPTDLSAFVRNRMLHKVMLRGIAGGKHTLKKVHVPVSTESQSDSEEESDGGSSDDDVDEHSNASESAATHANKTATGGVGMLRKQTTQRRMQVATRRMSSYRGRHAPIAQEIDRGLSYLKAAYDAWNRISQQLIRADIVAVRGALVPTEVGISAVAVSTDAKQLASGSSIVPTGGTDVPPLVAPEMSSTPFVSMRPRLQLHIEPLPAGPLMVSAKERDRSEAPLTPSSAHRRSMTTIASTAEWSFENSKLRLLSADDPHQLLVAVKGLHDVVHSTGQQRALDFTVAKDNLRGIRASQWHHACELASQFTCFEPPATTSKANTSQETFNNPVLPDDDRRHVFECVTFENEAIERMFGVEDHPDEELLRVQSLLERKKHVVRHALYCKHRPGATHAASLEDLWHVVKVLRLPRDVRVLPTLRDDELVGTSFFSEQFYSPDDVAEVLLQLCNEQFLPHISPLSARVEYFVTHHLPLAMQNQSAIREIMHKSDVKKALSDHSHTLRTIFRRYCAKEKDLLAAAAAKRRAAVVAATTTAAVSSVTTAANAAIYAANANAAQVPAAATAVPQGITKFMRLADWHEFISDYKLLRARFTAEYATVVFCNVQEAESGLEDNLEMIYSEFTEAIVALSVCFFPDPFLRHATRVHQFIRRYLPVSPEEIRDHHL